MTAAGLTVVSSPRQALCRLAKVSYGPLNPPRRPAAGPVDDWGRFDIHGGRTLYLAEIATVAFDEALAVFRRNIVGTGDPLAADAAALGMTVAELINGVDTEWGERGFAHTGHVPTSWRTARNRYTITLGRPQRWVQLDTADSLAATQQTIAARLAGCRVSEVDLSLLYGPNRAATVTIADWIRSLPTEPEVSASADESAAPAPLRHPAASGRFAGIVYRSRHGSGRCYAYWMTTGGPSRPPGQPTPRVTSAQPIDRNDPDLLDTAARFDLTVW